MGSASGDRRVVIIGAGPGGLCLGAKLRAEGLTDFVILEKSDGVGGTWRHNSYPGCECDVQSLLYSFSFFPSTEWSKAFARQPEILAYLERFSEAHDLGPHLRLGVEAHGARWDGATATWRVDTSAGEFEAEVLVGAVGMFNEIAWPKIDGLHDFGGTLFHSARWEHSHDLAGESVAFIGSGASAVQSLPEIAPVVGQLYSFQRHPQWVSPKMDPEFTDEDRELFRTHPEELARRRAEIYDQVNLGQTFSNPVIVEMGEQMGLQNLEAVEDLETRAKLHPHGEFGCHRPLSSNLYYPTFNLPHVEVVIDPIERVTSDAVVTVDGTARQVDTIICATGFATTKYLSVIDVTGRDGRNLNHEWEHGPHAALGLAVPGFPNMFMLYGPNTNNGSILFQLEVQSDHIVRQVQRLLKEDLATLEVRPDRAAELDDDIQARLAGITVWQGGCSGYYRGPDGRIVTQWPGSMDDYAQEVAALDDEEDFYLRGATP